MGATHTIASTPVGRRYEKAAALAIARGLPFCSPCTNRQLLRNRPLRSRCDGGTERQLIGAVVRSQDVESPVSVVVRDDDRHRLGADWDVPVHSLLRRTDQQCAAIRDNNASRFPGLTT